jgi:hypothetical protein
MGDLSDFKSRSRALATRTALISSFLLAANMANQTKFKLDPGASVEPRVEQIRGGTRIHMTTLIVAGVLMVVIILAGCGLLAFNHELAKTHGAILLQALIYLLFALVGVLTGYKLKHGE